MIDYYLKTSTEAAMKNAFLAARIDVTGVDGEVVMVEGVRVDIGWLGAIPGVAGYHANMRVCGELAESTLAELPILDPAPETPARVWA
jgi:hypothetical protein